MDGWMRNILTKYRIFIHPSIQALLKIMDIFNFFPELLPQKNLIFRVYITTYTPFILCKTPRTRFLFSIGKCWTIFALVELRTLEYNDFSNVITSSDLSFRISKVTMLLGLYHTICFMILRFNPQCIDMEKFYDQKIPSC